MGKCQKQRQTSQKLLGSLKSQRVAGEAIFEIGRRLKGVRENPQKYGFDGFRDWEQWCHEKLDMSRRNANRFIKVFDRFAEKPGTPVSRLPNSMSVLYALTDFNDDELEKPREMSDGSTKKLTEMSRREIEEFKAREKKAVEEKEKALLVAEEAENQRVLSICSILLRVSNYI